MDSETARFKILYSLELHLFYFIKTRKQSKLIKNFIHSQLNDTDGGLRPIA